ncbi:MAG: hypothetical protein ABR923_11260 [Terracidiphilus sp.]|jgi:hypothetical protein
MTASAWNWLLTIGGTVASIAGVVFSWMAWVQAKGAKEAAEEAARTVRTRETADEFLRLAADAKSLVASVQGQNKERAIESANNLAHLLMIAGAHRASYLPEGFSLDLAVENLKKVSTLLASEGFPEAPQKMARLLHRCHQIHESLCGISGSVQNRTEGAEG